MVLDDEHLITAAVTLSCLDASPAQGPNEAHLEQIHDRIRQRIQRANPPYSNARAGSG